MSDATKLGKERRLARARLGFDEDDLGMARSGDTELFAEDGQFPFPAYETSRNAHGTTSDALLVRQLPLSGVIGVEGAPRNDRSAPRTVTPRSDTSLPCEAGILGTGRHQLMLSLRVRLAL